MARVAGCYRLPAANVHWAVRVMHVNALAQGVTRRDLARRAGIDGSAINRWWSGACSPTIANVEAVLGVLGLTLAIEVKDENEPTPAG